MEDSRRKIDQELSDRLGKLEKRMENAQIAITGVSINTQGTQDERE